MNIEAYDLDSLRKIIRGLQEENRSLKSLNGEFSPLLSLVLFPLNRLAV